MIVLKIVNQQLVQVAFAAGQHPSRQVLTNSLSCQNRKQLNQFVRTLVQSSAQSQKVSELIRPFTSSARCPLSSSSLVKETKQKLTALLLCFLQITNANNQQLIPVARNISFRKCHQFDRQQGGSHDTSAKASFSISAADSAVSKFISADQFEAHILTDEDRGQHQSESPFELLKRKANDIKERREINARSKYYGQSFNEAMASSSERRLVVLLSWLEAKEKHIEKYRQFYLDRGFDVLNVKTSPLDLLLPNRGARKISEDFVRFMIEKDYSNVLLHGFSVGGYMFGRFLLEIDQHAPNMRRQLLDSIRGIVFDSLVPIEGVAVGVANSVTSNPVGAKTIEQLLRLYLFLGESIATKYFREASDKVWGGPLKCPTLFLMSKDDPISDHRIVERLANVWTDLGIDCHRMLVDSSPHVQLYTKHRDQYVKKVDTFLQHIKLA